MHEQRCAKRVGSSFRNLAMLCPWEFAHTILRLCRGSVAHGRLCGLEATARTRVATKLRQREGRQGAGIWSVMVHRAPGVELESRESCCSVVT